MLANQIETLDPIYVVDYDDALGVDCDQTAKDAAVYVIPYKCQVFQAGVVLTETPAGTGATPVVKFDKRPTAGSDTSRTDGTIANLVLDGSDEAGALVYDEVAAYGAAAGILEPGQEVVCELATAATGTGKAGHFRPVLVVKYIPETPANLTGMSETA